MATLLSEKRADFSTLFFPQKYTLYRYEVTTKQDENNTNKEE
jgi:hypothetical protein